MACDANMSAGARSPATPRSSRTGGVCSHHTWPVATLSDFAVVRGTRDAQPKRAALTQLGLDTERASMGNRDFLRDRQAEPVPALERGGLGAAPVPFEDARQLLGPNALAV